MTISQTEFHYLRIEESVHRVQRLTVTQPDNCLTRLSLSPILAAGPIALALPRKYLSHPWRRLTVRTMLQENTSLSESNNAAPALENGKRIRVLLAEDDRALRRFLEVVLERAGYKVIPVADGLEAMKVALSMPIDIVDGPSPPARLHALQAAIQTPLRRSR